MSQLDEFLRTDLAFKRDFIVTPGGDLDVVTGLANLKEALMRRLITTKGALVHRPNYGVGVKLYEGALNNIENRRRLAQRIKEQFELDIRVESVTGVSYKVDDNKPEMLQINVKVSVKGYGETSFGFIPFGEV